MGEYLKDIFWRALDKTLGSYGQNWETLLVSILAFSVPAALFWGRTRYRSGGWRAVVSFPVGWETTLKDVGFSVVAGSIVLSLVFIINVIRAAHERDSEAQRKVTVAVGEKNTADTARQTSEGKVARLERELSDAKAGRPATVIVSNEAEVARLRAELDVRARNSAIRERLAQLIRDGNKIMQACLVNQERPELQDMANTWAGETFRYLNSIEPVWAQVFDSASGFTFSKGIPQLNENVWNFVNLRVQALGTFADKVN